MRSTPVADAVSRVWDWALAVYGVAASCVYTLLYQDAGVVRSAYVVNKYKNSYSKYDTDYSTCKADIG